MQSDGIVTFERNPDGTISYEWTGGQRVAISYDLIRTLGHKPLIGEIIDLTLSPSRKLRLRLVDIAISAVGLHMDQWIVMRDGLYARTVANYVKFLHRHAQSIFEWECRVLRRRAPIEGEPYPRWSIVGILATPLTW